ncbi:DUF3566 domain-containing protein [Curtobacterium sp. MCPF17_002]|uniref:DUF3566 domain-containing protein n=1 Tax=Curtobacterium sp. MCPF17_002 TaxID=2175645 RepID=UPI0011B423DE|nr:DUF3566 domain-containing protein [Curtobacterium sp. MCPF17_002]WIB76985.1 DUF3566 domain-containing protein [Curtobacterium sp. MCPF17_002]
MLQRDKRPREQARQARLRLMVADTGSWTKLAALISLVLAVAGVLITTLGSQAVLSINLLRPVDELLHEITGDSTYSLEHSLSMAAVLGFAVPVAVLTVVVGTVIGAVAAILYNLAVHVSGGLIIGLANDSTARMSRRRTESLPSDR